MYKLNPNTNTYLFLGKAFEFVLYHRTPASINGKMFIKSKDAYWNFPPDLFTTQPGVASNFHEIKQILLKHIVDPKQFEPKQGAFLEGNVTTMDFYSLNTNAIAVQLPKNSKNFIEYRDPYNFTGGYANEFMMCMSWDRNKHSFINDESCGF